MREIKVRAWFPKERTMKGPVSLSGLIDFASQLGAVYGSSYKASELREEVIFLQFTGLTDKNGEEIYDGDVLKHDLWGSTQVIWEHGMFRGTNFSKDPHEAIDATLADHQLNRSRVIGNIYENPELVKED